MPRQAGGTFSLGVAEGGDDVGVCASGEGDREGGRGHQQRRELDHPARRGQRHLSGILQAGTRGDFSPPTGRFCRACHVSFGCVCFGVGVACFDLQVPYSS